MKGCAAVRDRLDRDFIVNARTDVVATMGLDEAIRRCNMYIEAGADLAFIDGIKTRADVEREGTPRKQVPRRPHDRRLAVDCVSGSEDARHAGGRRSPCVSRQEKGGQRWG